MDYSEDIRKLIMAGVGAVSVASEKAQEALETLSKRGEEAVSQGKVLNEQLRHQIKQAVKDSVTVVEQKPADKESILGALDAMSAEDRAELRARLDALEQGKPQEDKPDAE